MKGGHPYLEYVFLWLCIVLFRQMLGDLELDKILHGLGDGKVVGLVHILLLEPGLYHRMSRHFSGVRKTKDLKINMFHLSCRSSVIVKDCLPQQVCVPHPRSPGRSSQCNYMLQ